MRYPEVRYLRMGDELILMLHGFDGTVRCVTFDDGVELAAALLPGRAEADLSAVMLGFLPKGAAHVGAATVPDAEALAVMARACGDDGDGDDPLAAVRLRFSLDLIAARSGPVDARVDAAARAALPLEARRYDGLVDAIAQSRRCN